MTDDATPDYRPRFPDKPLGIGILGCGTIARSAHLPAYTAHELPVVGVWSLVESDTADAVERFPSIGRVYASADDLLADPAVEIVDLATPPQVRVDWIEKCVRAGKHVLAQKPLTTAADDLKRLDGILAEAEAGGVRVAVNQNGRWAPAWRLATLLVREGAVGEVVGVTHLHDKPLPPIAGTPFDDVEHMLIADYLMHWVDITCQWLPGIDRVQATDSRVPGQPDDARNPWSATVSLATAAGATGLLRVVGDVRTRRGGCPFWIHGTEGTIRGSVLLGSDALELESGDTAKRYALAGQWFVDGFAGTMGELMCAIREDREPENAAADVVHSVRVMLAALDSVRSDGALVQVGDAA